MIHEEVAIADAREPLAARLRPNRGSLLLTVPYALVIVLFIVNVATIQGFASRTSLIAVLVLSSFLGIASIGQTFAVIMGAVDLSVPAVIGLGDVVITQLYGDGWSFAPAALVLLGLVLAIGVANALATVYLKVHSLIITLGMGLIVSGAVLTWRPGFITGGVPSWLTQAVSPIGKTGPIAVPEVLFFWLVLAVITVFFQRRARLGREIYATGANPIAAPLARVRTTWAFVIVFSISAICAGITGVLLAGFSGTADNNVGQPYLFETLTAVVVGGTSMIGGRGGYGRTIAGALILSELTTLLVGLGFDASLQQALLGVLIVLLVLLYGRESHLSLRI
jgi:ribose transport system permease protein